MQSIDSNIGSMVSVIMPAYNCSKTIERAVKSVLNQTYRNLELIVVDDASTDETKPILEKMSENDPRVKLIFNKKNYGVAKTRNKAIDFAGGVYMAFLDSDDIWLPCKLELQITKMEREGAFVSHTSYLRVDSGKGQELGVIHAKGFVDYSDMLIDNYIGNLTGVYNCSALGKIYQESIGHEDYLMWLRVVKKAGSVGVGDVLAEYSVSSSSLSGNKIKSVFWHYNILRYKLDMPVLKCIELTLSYMVRGVKKRWF